MRYRARRFLHVLVCAPVVVLVATTSAPSVHAQTEPAPYVVAIDAGHGGSPDNAHPDMPFDSGAIAASGLQEKDATLAIAQEVQRLLQADRVTVVMTRTADTSLTITERERIATAAHASRFVSIHLNSFTDTSVGGSLILYPNDASIPFANDMSSALEKRLAPYGIANDGTQLRDNWWINATMPTVTVESAFLTNPDEAALLARSDFRTAVAEAIRNGLEANDPTILSHKAAVIAYEKIHPTPVVVATRTTASVSDGAVPWTQLFLFMGAGFVVIRWRRQLRPVFSVLMRVSPTRRMSARRRRSAVRRRKRLDRPFSVYDKLHL